MTPKSGIPGRAGSSRRGEWPNWPEFGRSPGPIVGIVMTQNPDQSNLLDEIERRQDDLLRQLDELNGRVEQAVREAAE